MFSLTLNTMFNISRLIIVLVLAALTTVSLFLLMHQLIDGEFIEPDTDPTVKIVDVRVDEPRKVKPQFNQPDKPEQLDPPPQIEFDDSMVDLDITLTPVVADLSITEAKPTFSMTSSTVPIAHLLRQPTYPQRALIKGIEGWVDLRYDISRQGKTLNIQVISAQPKGVFEKAAISAVRTWKYQPFVNGEGEPQVFVGLTKRVSFEIQK